MPSTTLMGGQISTPDHLLGAHLHASSQSGADAYCLLRRLIQRFRCDTMLWDYARQWNEPQEIRSTLRSDDVGEVMRGQMVYCACLPLEEGMVL